MTVLIFRLVGCLLISDFTVAAPVSQKVGATITSHSDTNTSISSTTTTTSSTNSPTYNQGGSMDTAVDIPERPRTDSAEYPSGSFVEETPKEPGPPSNFPTKRPPTSSFVEETPKRPGPPSNSPTGYPRASSLINSTDFVEETPKRPGPASNSPTGFPQTSSLIDSTEYVNSRYPSSSSSLSTNSTNSYNPGSYGNVGDSYTSGANNIIGNKSRIGGFGSGSDSANLMGYTSYADTAASGPLTTTPVFSTNSPTYNQGGSMDTSVDIPERRRPDAAGYPSGSFVEETPKRPGPPSNSISGYPQNSLLNNSTESKSFGSPFSSISKSPSNSYDSGSSSSVGDSYQFGANNTLQDMSSLGGLGSLIYSVNSTGSNLGGLGDLLNTGNLTNLGGFDPLLNSINLTSSVGSASLSKSVNFAQSTTFPNSKNL